ncbi:MAG: glycerate 2-kinase [Blastocatellia bacterium]|jgi:hydroxypyruvate reductase|nr:glycerate 2-kinase [Blastocatellia bacterium]
MASLTQLRLAAREIFDETLRAVDAGAAVRRSVRLDGLQLSVGDTTIDIGNRKIYAVAIGKAAFSMAYALEQSLGDSFTAGMVSGPSAPASKEKPELKLSARWQTREGSHPLPNHASLAAANEAFELLRRANDERALVIFLISGGGSAMLEWPANDRITLDDLRSANEALINCGASIGEINAVRRAFSAVKGGRLAMRAPACDQLTLIVSDVPQGEEQNVASGPTLTPPLDAPNAIEVIERYGLRAKLPESILRSVKGPGSAEDESTVLRAHFVLLDNHSALEAAAEAARRRGFATELAEDISDQPIKEGCPQLIERLNTLSNQTNSGPSNDTNVACLISGGEFACPVKGDGLGGRNLETALRLAMDEPLSQHFVALCAGTDGIDGNSPAAGAIVDSTTRARAQAIGLDPAAFLDRSDAYSFFVALGDAIATGATGTNVRDVRILLAAS